MLKHVKSGTGEKTIRPLPEEIPGTYSLGNGISGLKYTAGPEQCYPDSRELVTQQSVRVWVQNGAATLVILSFVGLLFCVLYRENDLVNKDIFNILLGILGTVVVQIFQYWFGASATAPGCGHNPQQKGDQS
jgi:hypothetical protein